MSRVPLSLVVITLNEAARLEKCLRSVPFADEILVVDSGSTDGTVALARELGARVIHQDWLGYGAQKQFAVEQAEHDWVLCLDADEWLSDELAQAIERVLAAPDADGYCFPRCNRFMGRWLRHGEGYPDLSLRLFRKSRGRWSTDPVHEKVMLEGAVKRIRGDLMHESEETLGQYLAKQNRYTDLQAEQLRARGKQFSLLKLLLSPLFRFIKFYVFRLGFLDGVPGLVHISIGCMNTYLKVAKLYDSWSEGK